MDATNEESFESLCSDLRDNRPRSSVSLVNASADQLGQLGASLRESNSLRCLTLVDGSLFRSQKDGAQADALCEFIENSPDFCMLEMDSGCEDPRDLCSAIAGRLLEAFGRNGCHERKSLVLSRLKLSDLTNGLGILMMRGSLEMLCLGDMHEIDEDDVEPLQKALSTSEKGFESLRLTQPLPSRACDALVTGLCGNPSLSSIILDVHDKNNVRALARLLSSCPSLQLASLSSVNISVDGLQALATNIGTTCTLSLLDLSKCSIGPEHAASLASLVRQLECLNVLVLDSNPLESEGSCELCKGFHGHNSLMDLSVADIGISGDISQCLVGLFRKNHSIKSISIEKNNLSACTRDVWEAMADNDSICDIWLEESFTSITSWLDICNAYTAIQHNLDLDWSIGGHDGNGDRTSLIVNASRAGREPCCLKLRCSSTSSERLAWFSTCLQSESCRVQKMTMTTELLSKGITAEFVSLIKDCRSLCCLQIIHNMRELDQSLRQAIHSLTLALPECRYLRRLRLTGICPSSILQGNLFVGLREALEQNDSLLWIEIQGLKEVESQPIEYFVLRNRVRSLFDAPIAIIPDVLSHRAHDRRPISKVGRSPKSLNMAFMTMRAFWGRIRSS